MEPQEQENLNSNHDFRPQKDEDMEEIMQEPYIQIESIQSNSRNYHAIQTCLLVLIFFLFVSLGFIPKLLAESSSQSAALMERDNNTQIIYQDSSKGEENPLQQQNLQQKDENITEEQQNKDVVETFEKQAEEKQRDTENDLRFNEDQKIREVKEDENQENFDEQPKKPSQIAQQTQKLQNIQSTGQVNLFQEIFNSIHQPSRVFYYNLTRLPEYKFYIRDFTHFYEKLQIKSFLYASLSKNHSLNIKEKKVISQKTEKYEWAHYENPKLVAKNAEKYTIGVSKGITLVWLGKNKNMFKQQWLSSKEKVISAFQKLGFFYDKLASMNLRPAANNNLLIFTKEKPQRKKSYKSYQHPKDFLSMMAPYRMEQNLPYMRQWIGYHVHLGADYIVLYDNYDTTGNPGINHSTENATKRGIKLQWFGQTQESMRIKFNGLWEDYFDYIIYLPWQPRNKKGKVFHGQSQSYMHYQFFFQDLSTATTFTDMDQYIFSPQDINIASHIEKKMEQGYTGFRLLQYRFGSRFCYNNTRVTDIYASIPIKTFKAGAKWLIKNEAFRSGSTVHDLSVKKGKKHDMPPKYLRFNHYNADKGSLKNLLRDHFTNAKEIVYDSSMGRYKEVIDEICAGRKCTEDYSLLHYPKPQNCIPRTQQIQTNIGSNLSPKQQLQKISKQNIQNASLETEGIKQDYSEKNKQKQKNKSDQKKLAYKILKVGSSTPILQFTDIGQKKYIDIEMYEPFLELPICVIVDAKSTESLKKIKASIEAQSFTNFKVAYVVKEEALHGLQPEFAAKVQNMSYFSLKEVVNSICQPESIILMASNPLSQSSLTRLNDLYQRYNTWITYSVSDGMISIQSFYRRVFDLVEKNDFDGEKSKYMGLEKPHLLALAFLELSHKFKKKVSEQQLFLSQRNQNLLRIENGTVIQQSRTSYQKLFSMNQDYKINMKQQDEAWKKFNENQEQSYYSYKAQSRKNMTQKKGLMGIENQELLYLSPNHSLAKRELEYLDNLYEIKKYQDEELPICITVPSFNNAAWDRSKKAVLSLLKQNMHYKNFHVVFLDDKSTDNTLEIAKKFFEEKGFPRQRVTFIQDLERKYAEYNIQLAAHMFCKEDEIQMILDGDDVFIGNRVLQLFNAVYRKNPNVWVAYSNYLSTLFNYGASSQMRKDNYTMNKSFNYHRMGLTRSWYVKLDRQIPLSHLQDKKGAWIESNADDAIQYALFDLAGPQRFLYVAQNLYLYSMGTGNNIYSSGKRGRKRIEIKKYLRSLPTMERIQSLEKQLPVNRELADIFEAEKGKKWKEVL